MTRHAPIRMERDHPRRPTAAPVAPKPLDEQLDELAGRVRRLGERRGDPEHFHAERSKIAGDLATLARTQRGDVRRAPSTTWRAHEPR